MPIGYTAGMGILVGMDEAGYGPNLGPLAVAASAWQVADEMLPIERRRIVSSASSAPSNLALLAAPKETAGSQSQRLAEVDLYRVLRHVVVRSPSERRIAIADSKILYKPAGGLRQLERGLHSVLRTMQATLGTWSSIVDHCSADPSGQQRRLAWHDGFDCVLPVDATEDELGRLASRLVTACDRAGVRPLLVRARLVHPTEFNELVAHYGSKGAALSQVTACLLREVLDRVGERAPDEGDAAPSQAGAGPPRAIHVVCDKHGGRNRYHSLLQHHFPEHWIVPLVESRPESRYHWSSAEQRVDVRFRTGGESFLPAALASMVAKYLRELAMRAFNEYWCARVPGLRPTAGYPLDAKRFKAEIAATQRGLGIEDHWLWRSR